MSDVSSVSTRRRSFDSLPGVETFLKRRGSTSHIFPPSSLKDLEQYVNKKRRSIAGLVHLEDDADIFRESSSLSLGRRQYSSGPLWEQEIAQGQVEIVPQPKRGRKKSNLLDKK
jgi:hypothetical protein